jgi:hypothetical protein
MKNHIQNIMREIKANKKLVVITLVIGLLIGSSVGGGGHKGYRKGEGYENKTSKEERGFFKDGRNHDRGEDKNKEEAEVPADTTEIKSEPIVPVTTVTPENQTSTTSSSSEVTN